MQARFYIDSATGLPHILSHDVNEDEVMGFWRSLLRIGPEAKVPGLRWAGHHRERTSSLFMFLTRSRTAYLLSQPMNLPAASCGFSQAEKEETTMSEPKFPANWDEQRVRRVLAHYEDQTEDVAVAEDEAGVQPSDTVMNVPHELVPKVRELIAKRQS